MRFPSATLVTPNTGAAHRGAVSSRPVRRRIERNPGGQNAAGGTPPRLAGRFPGSPAVGANALYRCFEHDTFGLGWPVFSKLMHHVRFDRYGDAGKLW